MDAILELGLLNGVLVAVLAAAVALVTCLCRRPALAHALWLLVLVKLITPPLVPVEVPWPQPMATEEKPAPVATAELLPPGPGAVPQVEEPVPDLPDLAGAPEELPPVPVHVVETAPPPETAPSEWSISWQTSVAALWLAGAGCWWSLAAWRLGRFRWLLRAARPASLDVQVRAETLANRLGLARCPRVCLLPAPLPPLLWSLFGAPCVFLPERLWEELSEEQQDTLLAHELAHLQRRDHWVRWLELVALGLYWWHPAAWWARRSLHESEELLCDARVLRTLPGAADAYAQALIQTIAFLSGPRLALPGAASGMGHVRPLKARVTMIMCGTNADRLPRVSAWALTTLGLVLLLLRPVWAPNTASAAQPDQPALAPAPQREAPPITGNLILTEKRGQNGRGYVVEHVSGDKTDRPLLVQVITTPDNVAQPGSDQQAELLRAQLAGKEAELQEARALLKLATQKVKRIAQLHERGAVTQDILDETRADYEVQQARVQGKEAQLREAQLRLAIAGRRSVQARQMGQRFGGGTMAPPGGLPANATRPVPTPRDEAPAVEVAPAGALVRPRSTVPIAPGFPPGPAAGRPPTPETVPGELPRGAGSRMTGRNQEERLQQLERRMEEILRELQALRRQMAPRGGGGGGGFQRANPDAGQELSRTPSPDAPAPGGTRPARP